MVTSASSRVSNHEAPPVPRDAAKRPLLGMRSSLYLLVGVDAPQPLLFDPAIEAVAGDVAPACGAVLDLGHDAGLQAGGDRAGRIGPIIERREFVLGLHGDDGGAATRQQRVIDPALGALGIPDPRSEEHTS